MTALTADRNTPARSGDLLLLTVYGIAATTIYAGSLVCVTSDGLAVPGGHAQAVRAIGRAEETVVNPLGGALTVTVRRGVFRFANQGADGYDVGRLVAVVDDQTISTLIAGDVVAEVIHPITGQVSPVVATVAGVLYARHIVRWATTGLDVGKVSGTRPLRSGMLLSA